MSSDIMSSPHQAESPSTSDGGGGGGGGGKTGCTREQKRRPKPRDGTILFCGVCGDRALGYNFDAVSCESCKAFFRRNALKTKPQTCSFDGNCKLDTHTRKFCSGCRMKKCFEIGMKKEWILSEDQLSKRRKRQQTRQGAATDGGTDIQPCTSTSMEHGPDSCYPHSTQSPNSGRENQSPPFHHLHHPHHRHYHHLPGGGYGNQTLLSHHDMRCDSSAPARTGSSSSSSHHHHYDLCPSPSPSTHHHHPQGDPDLPPSWQLHPGYIQESKWSQGSQDSLNSSPVSTNSQPSPTYRPSSASLQSYSQSPYSSPEGVSSATTAAGGEPQTKYLKTEPFSMDSSSFYAEPILPSQARSLTEAVSASSEHLSATPEVKTEPLTGDEDYSVPLSPYIKDMLEQMRALYDEVFEAPYVPEQVPKFNDNPKSPDELFNMTDIFIRRLIRFAKSLPEFKNLAQSDQIMLLKGGIMEMFLLRSAMGFDSKSKGWRFRYQQEHSDSAKVQEGKLDSKALNALGSSTFVSHISFVQELQEVTRQDRLVLMLLIVVELMSPERPQLENHVSVAKCQERHMAWLKAYLESVMPVAEARTSYQAILVKLRDVRLLGEEGGHLASSLDISNLAPLLVEVLDLKK